MSSLGSAGSVEIADCLFCANHRLEVCKECELDQREDNDLTFGFDPSPEREAISLPALATNKDGAITCKKHNNPECTTCFGWKKQLTKLHRGVKKAGK